MRGEGTAARGAVRVPPAPFDDGYDVRDPKALRVGKESTLATVERKIRTHLDLLSYIDLQKAYDSVDHTYLASARSFRSTTANYTVVEVIRQFHDEMRVCVRNDDGQCSEWFEVAQGLRQGCVLSPLLFNVFFAAILLVALERYS